MSRSRTRVVLLGAGGHAKSVIEALRASGKAVILGVLDADRKRKGGEICGVPILGDDGELPRIRARGVGRFAVSVGDAGGPSLRRRLFELGRGAGFTPFDVIHPSAVVASTATLGEGCQVLAGAIVGADARLGENVIVNNGAIVEHDCVVGAHAHLASGCRLGGAVSVGEGVLVGAGATLLPGVAVGDGSIVGAGAVVVADVPGGVVVSGVPARRHPLRSGRTPSAGRGRS